MFGPSHYVCVAALFVAALTATRFADGISLTGGKTTVTPVAVAVWCAAKPDSSVAPIGGLVVAMATEYDGGGCCFRLCEMASS